MRAPTALRPLCSREAEEAVLGTLLVDPETALPLVRDCLAHPDAFYWAPHRAVYAAVLALSERGQAVDHVALADELALVDAPPGADFLARLAEEAVPVGRVSQHAATVRDLARRRELVCLADEASERAGDRRVPIAEAIAGLVDALVRAAQPETLGDRQSQGSELMAVLDEIEQQATLGDRLQGVSSGLPQLDDLTDGWVPGRLIVVAGRPKMGKTGFALHCTRAACEADQPVYFLSAEQPRRELLKRLLGMEAESNLRAITSPEVLAMQTGALSRAAAAIHRWPLVIDDRARTPSTLRLGLQHAQADRGKVGLVVVDYLGKLHSGQRTERHDLEIAAITGALGELAMQLDVPVMLLCQLNRESVRGGQTREPGPADLRDSGAIEQDASQVIFLWRPDATSDEWPPHRLQLLLKLNRHGPTDAVDAAFDRATGRWRGYLHLGSRRLA
jgi:replicative DNA helicase